MIPLRNALALSVLAALAAAAPAQNLLLGKTVTGTGTYGGALGSVTDGLYLPASTPYNSAGTVYWNGTAPTFTIALGGPVAIGQLRGQFDDNDSYLVEYQGTDGAFRTAWTVANLNPSNGNGLFGMQSRPDLNNPDARYTLAAPITATALRITAIEGDNIYAVSELQAFAPAATPEPSALAALGLGSAAFARRRRKD